MEGPVLIFADFTVDHTGDFTPHFTKGFIANYLSVESLDGSALLLNLLKEIRSQIGVALCLEKAIRREHWAQNVFNDWNFADKSFQLTAYSSAHLVCHLLHFALELAIASVHLSLDLRYALTIEPIFNTWLQESLNQGAHLSGLRHWHWHPSYSSYN